MNDFIEKFKKGIIDKKIRIAVVGLGYVGLPLAVEFANEGFSVLGIDLDKDRIKRIKKGISYISDVKSNALKKNITKQRLIVTDKFSILKDVDVILICVPTPLKRKYSPDISFIKEAVRSISINIKKGALVILESTTYPGTTEEVILPMFKSKGLREGEDFFLCFSPERIDPGNTKYPLSKIPKIIGGLSKEALHLGKLVYSSIIKRVIPVSSTRVAETVKLLENTFRIVNIGLINEIAMMAHKMNIDIWEIIEAAKTKPFGFMPFYPGPGVGGHCIGKDPLYLYWKARHHGFKSRFIKLASDIVSSMPQYIADRVIALIKKENNISSPSILIIGVTYKKDVKDLRKSPAVEIIDILQKKKVSVSYYDPLIPYLKLNHINLKSIALNKNNLHKFDCVLIATDHSKLDYDFILKHSRLIFDTRNVYKGLNNSKLIRL